MRTRKNVCRTLLFLLGCCLLVCIPKPVYAEDELEVFQIQGDNIIIGSELKDSEVATQSLEVHNQTVRSEIRVSYFDSADFGAGHQPEISTGIKYIVEDSSNGDSRGPDGKLRNRYVYCLEHMKSTPSDQILRFNNWENPYLYHVIYHGAMYYGETSRFPTHSTGNWQWDYLATHFAIVVITGQFSLEDVIISIQRGTAPVNDQNLLINAITNMVNDALSMTVHPGFDEDGWFRMDDKNYSAFSLKKGSGDFFYQNGNYYSPWITPWFTTKNGYYANSDIWSLDNVVTEGVTIEKRYSDSIHSPYRLVISEKQYDEWKKTGKDISSKVTIVLPSYWRVARFTPSGDKQIYQSIGFPVYAGGMAYTEFSDEVSFSIPRQSVDLEIKKIYTKSGEATDDDQILAGAEFTLYSDEDCKKPILVKVTDESGTAVFSNLNWGSVYYLKETSAPPGYSLPDEEKIYTIQTKTEDKVLHYTVYNQTGSLLPETGSGIMICSCFAGTVIMTTSLRKKRKRGNKK